MNNVISKMLHYSDQMSIAMRTNNGKLFDESCYEYKLLLAELKILAAKQHETSMKHIEEHKKQQYYKHCLSVVR